METSSIFSQCKKGVQKNSSRSGSDLEKRSRQLEADYPEKLKETSSSDVKAATSSLSMLSLLQKKLFVKQKYGFIPDNFSSLDQVTQALRDAGLESSNLIIGIDFTKSNEWTGKNSFNNRSLHAIGDIENPYEKAISVIGKTLAPLDDD